MGDLPAVDVVTGESETTFALLGEIDLATAPQVSGAMEVALASDPSSVRLDLSRVSFLDSVGISLIVGLRNDTRASGTPLRLTPGPLRVMRVLELAGLTDIFDQPG